MYDLDKIKKQLNTPDHKLPGLIAAGNWAGDFCLICGASPTTAFQVAAVFVAGLEKEYENVS